MKPSRHIQRRAIPIASVMMLIALIALPALADDGNASRQRRERLRAEAEALLAPIEKAGGHKQIAERLKPWRETVAGRIAAIPRAKRGGGYVAGDLPIDGGDGWILSGRRARQLIYESDFEGKDATGDRRYAQAEKALMRTHRELQALGIRLIVVPAPDKCDIFPERIAPLPDGVPTVHLKSKQLYMRLLHAGVEVVDCEEMLRSRKGKESGPLYMMRDTHWSPAGSRLVAHEVARRLDELKVESDAIIERPDQRHQWDGDLAENWRRAGRKGFPKETHKFIGVATRHGRPVHPSSQSPVLVLGDSYSTYPYNGYFSFWAFLSERMGYPVGFADHAGGGNTIIKHFARMPAKKRKPIKVIVLLFTSCSFYEVDFKEIPLSEAPLPAPALRQVKVRLQADAPAIRPKTAPYKDAIAGIPAKVDRGDGVPIDMQIYARVMKERKLLTAASWKKGQTLILDLHPAPAEGQAGVMVIEDDVDADMRVGYVR